MVINPGAKHSFVGPIATAMNDVDLAWVVGLVVTGVAYFALARSIDVAAEATLLQEPVVQEVTA